MLGKKYRDVLTGFEGVCTGYTEYISGCQRILLTPKSDDPKKTIESEWFDIVTCEVIDETPISLPGRIFEAIHSLLPGPVLTPATGPGKEAPKR